MLRLQTPVEFPQSGIGISYSDSIMLLGSCFSDNIGKRLQERGFDACLNPFGTLYNPESILSSILRLDSGEPFTEKECVRMGSGSALWCSFSHHTLAARESPGEFLRCANEALAKASEFWRSCNKVIITFGTSWCFRFTGAPRTENIAAQGILNESSETGRIVSNCLKRDAREFTREFLPAGRTAEIVSRIVREHPDKKFIFTVSPIRHLKDGAHGNALSKASLLLGIDEGLKAVEGAEYFPSYEILMDELRDYRFYAPDMLHPSEQAADYIFSRFIDWALPETDRSRLQEEEMLLKRSKHYSKFSTALENNRRPSETADGNWTGR